MERNELSKLLVSSCSTMGVLLFPSYVQADENAGVATLLLAKSQPIEDVQPNIVFIMCDDVSYDMFGCYGNKQVYTPHIDALADDGVVFRTGWNSALSGPARAQIMTGCYATSTNCWSNGLFIPAPDRTPLFERFSTFSSHIQAAGYATAVGGKWNVGDGEHPKEAIVGFDEYCLWESDYELEQLGLPVWTGGREDPTRTARYWHPCIVRDLELVPTGPTDFGPDVINAFMCDFIERSAAKGDKFLAYYPMLMPHGPYVLTPLDTTEGSNEEDKSQKEAHFIQMINYIDILVGRVIAQLEESGVRDNTLIVFTADNGTAVTAKSRGVERGCHVPYIFSGKGVNRRGVTAEICDGTDMFPTLLDYAGVTDMPSVEGVSLKPFLMGATERHKDFIHSCIGGTQLLRTRTHLLEVVSPILDMADGRFYYCGDNAGGHNYVRAEGDVAHAEVLAMFRYLLANKYVGLKADNPYFLDGRGASFLKSYLQSKEKHIHNHKDYVRYNED